MADSDAGVQRGTVQGMRESGILRGEAAIDRPVLSGAAGDDRMGQDGTHLRVQFEDRDKFDKL
jgi:hypothetical protein